MVQIYSSGRRRNALPNFAFLFYSLISFAGVITVYLWWSIIQYAQEENAPNPISTRQEQVMHHRENIRLAAKIKDESVSNELRKKALEAAKDLTSKRIEFEEEEMDPLYEIRENYAEAKKKAWEEEELQKQLKEKEDAYYQYYEDNDDADCTVITMSYNAEFIHYIRFVSSLRDNGYEGNIIIGIEKDQDPEIVRYLKSQNVTIHTLIPTECTFESAKPLQKCYYPYQNIRREWSHFPLIRDWLINCPECTGPVLFMSSMKRAYFQTNPFGAGSATKKRLQIFQHHRNFGAELTPDTELLHACYNIDFPAKLQIDPKDDSLGFNGMLTSDIAAGRRDDVIDYLSLVYSQIREWMQGTRECYNKELPADIGRPIVNYLHIQDRLPFNTRIVPHRVGEVNLAVYEGTLAYESHLNMLQFKGLSLPGAESTPYEGSTEKSWIDTDYLLTNDDGDFINVFYEKSVIIIDYETYGKPFLDWLDKKMNFTTSNYNVVEKKKPISRDGKENDDFYIKAGDKAKPSKEKQKRITKKPKIPDRSSMLDESEGEEYDGTDQTGETTGMYYAPEKSLDGADDVPGDHDTSNNVPVEISHEEVLDEGDEKDKEDDGE